MPRYIWFLWRDVLCALHGIARVSRPSVRLSVRLSVTLIYRGHISWTSLKIITLLISLESSLLRAPTPASWLSFLASVTTIHFPVGVIFVLSMNLASGGLVVGDKWHDALSRASVNYENVSPRMERTQSTITKSGLRTRVQAFIRPLSGHFQDRL